MEDPLIRMRLMYRQRAFAQSIPLDKWARMLIFQHFNNRPIRVVSRSLHKNAARSRTPRRYRGCSRSDSRDLGRSGARSSTGGFSRPLPPRLLPHLVAPTRFHTRGVRPTHPGQHLVSRSERRERLLDAVPRLYPLHITERVFRTSRAHARSARHQRLEDRVQRRGEQVCRPSQSACSRQARCGASDRQVPNRDVL